MIRFDVEFFGGAVVGLTVGLLVGLGIGQARGDCTGCSDGPPIGAKATQPELCIFASDVQAGLYRWRACEAK